MVADSLWYIQVQAVKGRKMKKRPVFDLAEEYHHLFYGDDTEENTYNMSLILKEIRDRKANLFFFEYLSEFPEEELNWLESQ